MTVRVNYDEPNDLYELGDEVDGVFFAFASRPGTDVRAAVEAAHDREERTGASAPTAATATSTGDELAAKDAQIAELEAQLAEARGGGGGGA
jgi:hypothetical protein